jgi:hypothetical protein
MWKILHFSTVQKSVLGLGVVLCLPMCFLDFLAFTHGCKVEDYQVDDSKEYSCKHKTLLAPNYLFFHFTDPKTKEKKV